MIFAGSGSPQQQWALSRCSTPGCLPGSSTSGYDRSIGLHTSDASGQQARVNRNRNTDSADPADSVSVVPPPDLTEAVLLDTIVRFQGSPTSGYVRNIGFSGVRFAHSATTQLNRYEVREFPLSFERVNLR